MLTEISSKTLIKEELPQEIKEEFPLDKKVLLSEWAGKDKWILIHDGKYIICHHGPEAISGTGNPDYVMVAGTEKEIEEEIKRLGLVLPPTEIIVPEKDLDDGTLNGMVK